MPLFVDNKTFVITYRKHEFNTEYLDGLLDLVKDDANCTIIAHHPNKKFGYDIGIIKTIEAEAGWEEVAKLGHYDAENPVKIFYELVPEELFKEYSDNPKFTVKDIKQDTPDKNDKPTVIKDQYDIPPIGTTPPSPKPPTPPTPPVHNELNAPGPSLVRNSEAAIYTYKTPSQKFG